MRRFLPVLLLLASTCTIPAAVRGQDPPDEPPVPEKLDKVMLTLDLGGHSATVTGILVTPDSKQIVTVSADHTARVWDAATATTVRVLYPPGVGGLSAAALAPDGKTLAVGSRYPEGGKNYYPIYLLSLADGRIERVLRGQTHAVEALAYAADGKHLASTYAGVKDGAVTIWDLDRGKPDQAFPFAGDYGSPFRPARRGLAFAPDGRRLARARASGGPSDLLDLASGKTVPLPGAVGPVAWSPDGKVVATAAGAGPAADGILLWDADQPQAPRRIGAELKCNSLAFSADSRTLLATWGTPGAARAGLFDVAAGPLRVTAKAKWPRSGALSPDGQWAATTAFDRGIHGLTIWQTADGAVVRESASPLSIFAARGLTGWTPDGTTIIWPTAAKKWRGFNLGKLDLVAPPDKQDIRGPVARTARGGLTLEKKDKGIEVTRDGTALYPLKGYAQTFLGNDRAATSWGGMIVLYDAATGKELRRLRGHHDEVIELAPSPDGRFLLSTSLDQTLRVWDPDKDRPLLSLYVKGNDWVAWTEEGYYAATPGGERLVGWKVNNGINKAASFYPAEQFRKVLYRPDVVQQVLPRGNVKAAVEAANAARAVRKQVVPRAEANPEKLLPPLVTLGLEEKSPLPRVVLTVSARQSCAEQPIKALRLLVDGRPLPNRQASVSFLDGQEKAHYDTSWTVELPPGKHKLSVLARSKDDTPGVSNALTVACPLPPEARPVLHHVAVGVSKYKNPKLDLSYADADAAQLAAALAKPRAGAGNYYRAVRSHCLLNQQATRPAVLKAIAAVRKEAKANDLFVFSFAGHGVREEGEFYLLTHEADPTNAQTLPATAISGAALREALTDFPCQVLLMLDACHSGAFGAGALAGYRPGTDEAARSLADVDLRVAVMCAALGHEEALEQQGNGLFTRAVLRALQHDPHCFYDHQTGELNIYHLQAFVSQEVARESDARQTPYLKMPLASPPFVVTQFAH